MSVLLSSSLVLLTIEYAGVQFATAGIHRVDPRRPTTGRSQVSNMSHTTR